MSMKSIFTVPPPRPGPARRLDPVAGPIRFAAARRPVDGGPGALAGIDAAARVGPGRPAADTVRPVPRDRPRAGGIPAAAAARKPAPSSHPRIIE